MYENARMRVQREILQAETGKFGYAQPGSKGQVQHGTIPDAGPIDRLGCVKKRLDLRCSKMSHQPRVSLLHRDGQDASDLFQSRRHSILYEVHERLDGGQSNIAGAHPV